MELSEKGQGITRDHIVSPRIELVSMVLLTLTCVILCLYLILSRKERHRFTSPCYYFTPRCRWNRFFCNHKPTGTELQSMRSLPLRSFRRPRVVSGSIDRVDFKQYVARNISIEKLFRYKGEDKEEGQPRYSFCLLQENWRSSKTASIQNPSTERLEHSAPAWP